MAESNLTETHSGLTVNVRKVGILDGLTETQLEAYRLDESKLTEQELTEKYGAGLYEFYVDLDGVPVVFHVKKAGTVDQQRTKIAEAKAKAAAAAPPPPPPAE